MIHIQPGSRFVMTNPNTDERDRERAIAEVTRIIRASSPFIESLEFLNQTKHCTIDIVFMNHKVQVLFKNPEDEIFRLEEPNDAQTRSNGSGPG